VLIGFFQVKNREAEVMAWREVQEDKYQSKVGSGRPFKDPFSWRTPLNI
jgi:hypothetical protein